MNVEHLQSFLDATEPNAGGRVISCVPIPGGYSRRTVLSEVQWADGSTERFVLRGDPPVDAGVFTSDRDAEWLLLNALQDLPTFTIAKPRWYDATGEHMGMKCIISEAVASSSMQGFLETGPDLDQARQDFIEIIASVHLTPLDLIADTITRPETWDAHIDRLMGVYDEIIADLGESNPVLHYVRRKMRANRPPAVPLTLVHGDCQPGNFLLSATTDPVIIDWEFGQIGDPRQDLGYYLQIPMPPHLYHPNPEAFLASYRDLTGLNEEQVNPKVIEYFMLIGMVHLMRQMLLAAEDVAQGRHHGILGTYLMLAITHFHHLFMNVALALPNAPESRT